MINKVNTLVSDATQDPSKQRDALFAEWSAAPADMGYERWLEQQVLGLRATAEPPAVTWPQSKGDPAGPVWSYGGKKRMSQTEALRMMAHDLVERIKWLEAEPRAVLKQARDIDGVDAFALIKALHKTIDGQRKHIATLETKLKGKTFVTDSADELPAAIRDNERHAIFNVLQYCKANPLMASGIDVTARQMLQQLYDRTEASSDVIRTRAFWSRDRKDLISAYVSDTDITLMDDNSHIYEPAGDEQRHGPAPKTGESNA